MEVIDSIIIDSLIYSVARFLNALAGFPARIVLLGNDFVTTDPAPTMQ